MFYFLAFKVLFFSSSYLDFRVGECVECGSEFWTTPPSSPSISMLEPSSSSATHHNVLGKHGGKKV